jgi:hypothetical protein
VKIVAGDGRRLLLDAGLALVILEQMERKR